MFHYLRTRYLIYMSINFFDGTSAPISSTSLLIVGEFNIDNFKSISATNQCIANLQENLNAYAKDLGMVNILRSRCCKLAIVILDCRISPH